MSRADLIRPVVSTSVKQFSVDPSISLANEPHAFSSRCCRSARHASRDIVHH
jgi:hypothetical protein